MKFFWSLVLACAATVCTPEPPDGGSNSDGGPQEQDAGPAGAGIGEPCEGNEECASDLCGDWFCRENECDAVGDPCDGLLICSGGPCRRSCEPKGDRGSSCLNFSDDYACPTSTQCAEPLVCGVRNFGKFGDGVCVPEANRDEGEPCQAADQCSSPLTCDEELQRCR